MDSEKGCVGLQLSEVTKNKTLKQTDLWILITALRSEKTELLAHLRSGEAQREDPMDTRTVQALQKNPSAEEAEEF